tara:strand:- start:94 stop:489 length:396 start_codon:yes stop_codon:yes gene_type:complete
MAEYIYKLKFKGTINPSVQVGDTVWTSGNIGLVGSTNTFAHNVTDDEYGESNMSKVGEVISIINSGNQYEVSVKSNQIVTLSVNKFYLFSKSNKANKSSIKGYYNSVTLSNDSTTKAELFATTFEISQSSK